MPEIAAARVATRLQSDGTRLAQTVDAPVLIRLRYKGHLKVALSLETVSSAAADVAFFGVEDALAGVCVPNVVSVDDVVSSCELENGELLLDYYPSDVIQILRLQIAAIFSLASDVVLLPAIFPGLNRNNWFCHLISLSFLYFSIYALFA